MKRLTPAEIHLKRLGITEPCEIDLEAIAWDAKAVVRYEPLDGCEARIIGYGDRAIITVDPGKGKRRKRFSTGHELGHWRHHHGQSFVCRSDDIGNQVLSALHPERIADAYAADLLLPEYLFRPLAQQFTRVTIEAIGKLAEAFTTSLTATALRMVQLGPVPAMLICHTATRRKWFRPGPDVPSRWFPRDDLDAESGAFEVLHGQKESSRQILIGADAWFDRYEAARYELYEQSVRVTENEVLTLLVFKDAKMLEEAA